MGDPKTKTDGVAALEAIIKKQDAKLEKLQKTIDEKNKELTNKDKRISEFNDKVEQLESIAVTAQDEVNKSDIKHSEEMTLVLEKLNVIEAQIKQLLARPS
jgi:uncharacterized protein (DUF3084 family)